MQHVALVEAYEENSASCWHVVGKGRSISMDFSNTCEFLFLHISQIQQMIVSSRLASVWNLKLYPCAFILCYLRDPPSMDLSPMNDSLMSYTVWFGMTHAYCAWFCNIIHITLCIDNLEKMAQWVKGIFFK